MSRTPDGLELPMISRSSERTVYTIPLPLPPTLPTHARAEIARMVNEELARLVAETRDVLVGNVEVGSEECGTAQALCVTYFCTVEVLLRGTQKRWRAASMAELYAAIASTLELIDPGTAYPPFEEPAAPAEPTPEDVRRFRVQALRVCGGITGTLARVSPEELLKKLPWADVEARHLADRDAKRAYEAALAQRFAVFGDVERIGKRTHDALMVLLAAKGSERESKEEPHSVGRVPLCVREFIELTVSAESESYRCKVLWGDDPTTLGLSLLIASELPSFKIKLLLGEVCPLASIAVAWEPRGPTLLPRGGASFTMAARFFPCLRRK